MARGFTNPVLSESNIRPLDPDLLQAHNELVARRKLNLILRSNISTTENLHVGDLVQVYLKSEKEKGGRWSSPRQILYINHDAGFVTVPGRSGKTINSAIEDVRTALPASDLTESIQSAIDEVDGAFNNVLENRVDLYSENEPASENDVSADSFDNDDAAIIIGPRIEIYWPADDQYYAGTVSDIDSDNKVTVYYNDNDKQYGLNLVEDQWRFPSISANIIQFDNSLQSSEQVFLNEMFSLLGNKSFFYHQAHAFDQFPMILSHQKEEAEFLKNVKKCRALCLRKMPILLEVMFSTSSN